MWNLKRKIFILNILILAIDTWFLVGVAARIATGMGLHTAEVYRSLAVDAAEQQKRIFFCLYMMDRYVQLGSPLLDSI